MAVNQHVSNNNNIVRLKPVVISRDQHNMRCRDLSPNTLKVLERLIDNDYEAYAVGGCVRDTLLGQTPKDFDVVTNATPEQIKSCFRNCRLIGRRFRLAHITFGREIIEVATFRGHHTNESSKEPEESDSSSDKHKKLEPLAKQNESGQLVRDNIFGSIEEDAARRDFTFNAMYFCIKDESILDFADGLNDIASGKIKIIGNSELRFMEDPVRMIRAIRFASKLNMFIDKELTSSIRKNAHLLSKVPPARLFEEINKLLLSGCGVITFEKLIHYHLLAPLFPLLMPLLTDVNSKEYQFVIKMLKNTDNRINNNQRITPAFLYAAFLWYPMEERAQERMNESSIPWHDAVNLASADVIFQQCRKIMIPKRFSIVIRDIWSLQLRLQKRQGRRTLQLLTHPKFRAAYDFLLLRGEVEGGELLEISQWWTEFQTANDANKNKLLQALPNKTPRRRNRKKVKNKENRK